LTFANVIAMEPLGPGRNHWAASISVEARLSLSPFAIQIHENGQGFRMSSVTKMLPALPDASYLFAPSAFALLSWATYLSPLSLSFFFLQLNERTQWSVVREESKFQAGKRDAYLTPPS